MPGRHRWIPVWFSIRPEKTRCIAWPGPGTGILLILIVLAAVQAACNFPASGERNSTLPGTINISVAFPDNRDHPIHHNGCPNTNTFLPDPNDYSYSDTRSAAEPGNY